MAAEWVVNTLILGGALDEEWGHARIWGPNIDGSYDWLVRGWDSEPGGWGGYPQREGRKADFPLAQEAAAAALAELHAPWLEWKTRREELLSRQKRGDA